MARPATRMQTCDQVCATDFSYKEMPTSGHEADLYAQLLQQKGVDVRPGAGTPPPPSLWPQLSPLTLICPACRAAAVAQV